MLHNKLKSLIPLLGYDAQEGLCHGFSIRWLEACLLSEEDEDFFTDRLNTILNKDQTILKEFNLFKKKFEHIDPGNDKEKITRTEKNLLDILAFYESILILHLPTSYVSLFNNCVNQYEIEKTSCLAGSNKALAQGGLQSLYSEYGAYTEEEFKNYLHNIQVIVNETKGLSNEKIGLVLHSYNHAIGLIYHPQNGR